MRTKIRRIKESDSSTLRPKESDRESAGENLVGGKPPERVAERTRPEVPAAAAPAADDRPQNAVDVADVADVGISVRQERTRFATWLLRKSREELAERDFDFGLTAEERDDGGVVGVIEEVVHGDGEENDRLLRVLDCPLTIVIGHHAEVVLVLDEHRGKLLAFLLFSHGILLWPFLQTCCSS